MGRQYAERDWSWSTESGGDSDGFLDPGPKNERDDTVVKLRGWQSGKRQSRTNRRGGRDAKGIRDGSGHDSEREGCGVRLGVGGGAYENQMPDKYADPLGERVRKVRSLGESGSAMKVQNDARDVDLKSGRRRKPDRAVKKTL